jgi:hypothetical protein
MPPDSNWNTPVVSPRWKRAKTVWSVYSEALEVEGVGPLVPGVAPDRGVDLLLGSVSRMIDLARSMTDRVRRPRKSILRRPISSQVGPSHWVMTSSEPDCL